MSRQRSAATFAVMAAILSAFALSACGSSSQKGTLSRPQADSMNQQLSAVDAAVAAGDCAAATDAAGRLSDIVNGLPASVDPALKANLLEGARNVGDQAQIDCVKSSTTTSSSTTTTSSSTEPTTTTSSSSTTSSTTTTTPTTTTTTTDGGGAGPTG